MAVGVVTAMTAAGVGLWPRHQLLLPRATRLLPLRDGTYYWLLNEHEALSIQDDPPPGHWQRYPTVHIFRQDPKTGRRVPVPALSAWYNSLLMNYNYEFQPSRDGKWLLLTQSCLRVHASGLTTVDGAHHTEYDRDGLVSPNGLYRTSWLQDGQHWAEILDDDSRALLTLLIHDVKAQGKRPTKVYCRVPKTFNTYMDQVVVASMHHVVGIGSPSNREGSPNPAVTVFEADPLQPARQTHVYTIHVPIGYEVRDVVLSPDGNRLLWRFVVGHTDPIRQLLHRLLPTVQVPMTLRTDLCVSQMNGDGMRDIGYQNGDPDDFNAIDETCYTRWLPDGKCVSFRYKSTVYTVPID